MHRVVPELIVESYREGRYSGDFQAVGLFLDLSGFSTMTDVLMQYGQHGAEVLAGLMGSDSVTPTSAGLHLRLTTKL